MSKARLRIKGRSPIMRNIAGLRTSTYPRICSYSVTLPFLAPPTAVSISTVACMVEICAASSLMYFTSSGLVAVFSATGAGSCGTVWVRNRQPLNGKLARKTRTADLRKRNGMLGELDVYLVYKDSEKAVGN